MTKSDNNKDRNIREMAYIKSPNMSIYEYDDEGNLTSDYFTPINSYQGNGIVFFNPVAVSNLGKKDKNKNNLQNTFTLNYSIKPWIRFRETLSFQFEGSKESKFLPYNAIGSDWLDYRVNLAGEGNNLFSSINTETQLSFNTPNDSSDHVLSGAFTWITNQQGYEWMNVQSNQTPSTSIQDPATNAQVNWIGGGSGQERSLGALLNLNYKYRDKYMLQTILRADAHSSFGANHRWGLFKGLSVGWRFSKEPFMQSIPFLGESMLRASWGVSGRQPTDVYARFATYNSPEKGNYMPAPPAIVNTQIQLDNLQWESITSWDLGIELNLFHDRLYVEGDIYNKKTTELLFEDYDIPKSSGFKQLKFYNGGELGNKGWELMTDYKLMKRKDFIWSVNFNISHNVNTFNSLPENFNKEQSTTITNGEYPKRVVEGQPIGSFFGFKYEGVFPTDEDALARDAQGELIRDNEGNPMPIIYGTYPFKGGDAKYMDINHDGKIDLNDVVYIGDSNPDFIGGFGTAVKYKGLEVSCGFHYRMGFDIINGVAIETEGMNNRNNQSKAVLNRWRVQGQNEPGMLPRAYMNHPANNLGSDRYVEQGDFLQVAECNGWIQSETENMRQNEAENCISQRKCT